MHTGKLVWTFHSIPRAGEKYNDTWAADSWKNRSGVNVWGFITVDAQRGIVYMPFGAPSVDQYGGDRAGDNLVQHQPRRGGREYREVPVALPGRPSRHLGRRHVRRAGAHRRQAGRPDDSCRRRRSTSPGSLFLLDRVTGKPIYGVEERPVPQSEVPLERDVEDAAVSAEAARRFRA